MVKVILHVFCVIRSTVYSTSHLYIRYKHNVNEIHEVTGMTPNAVIMTNVLVYT